MAKKSSLKLYDAFPTQSGARRAALDLKVMRMQSFCDVRVRKLKPAQDGGRLKYGVYVAPCKRVR